jgi:hypothetical protein
MYLYYIKKKKRVMVQKLVGNLDGQKRASLQIQEQETESEFLSRRTSSLSEFSPIKNSFKAIQLFKIVSIYHSLHWMFPVLERNQI